MYIQGKIIFDIAVSQANLSAHVKNNTLIQQATTLTYVLSGSEHSVPVALATSSRVGSSNVSSSAGCSSGTGGGGATTHTTQVSGIDPYQQGRLQRKP